MKTLKIILAIIGLLLVLAFVFFWNMGLFTSVNVAEREEGGYKVVGMEYTGSYSDAGKSMMDIDKKLKETGIICTKGFGIYYDNPQVTPKEKCRSFVGNILEEKDLGRITELLAKGFKVDSVPKGNAVVVELPIKNNISYMIGPIQAYPAISKYMQAKGYKPKLSLEVYDVPVKKIYYIMQYSL